MRLFLVLSLIAFPIFDGAILSSSSTGQFEHPGLDAKNPGCDPDVHECPEGIS
ncbi:MAG: hypothetical protein AAGD25_10900 [Cyanobacteria bacterium P01_F01_bin.150]